ncbi:MAG: flavodoxin-dependent (E)-4-hydroxy-3-methylbut-2-enyl-diphosphate synthase [Bacilli bacterium]|nr:flavodoxin-dependent (E)-4-hydroxy-3-methylbut-2-enyl-diphosphate synthase [Bacilli bacterium]
MDRLNTRPVLCGKLQLGHQNRVLIQSMCNIKTSNINEVISQIKELSSLGCDIIRVSIKDQEDAYALKEITSHISIPLVADIHFDYRLAILAIENGANKIRINPGNIGSIENVKKVVDKCKEYNVPIRIGVNSGSIDNSVMNKDDYKVSSQNMIDSIRKHVKILENLDFYDIVLSLKSSSVLESVEAYRMASKEFPYPLHLGITEAGNKETGLIRSVAGLAPLLLDGIGDTIRISLSDDPREEVIACKKMLHDIGLYPNYPTFISCPTCGRTEVDLIDIASKVQKYCETLNKAITVAIMGCVVNGPGEAKQADIGLAGGKNEWVLFKKGKVICKVSTSDAYETLIKEIETL